MAARYFVGTNWNSTASWSDTDGGAGGFSIPISTDDVFFTAASGACNLDTTGSGQSLNFTGYANTISGSNILQIGGNVTLSAAMTITVTELRIIAAATITSNGNTVNGLLAIRPSSVSTVTLADAWTVNGNLNLSISAVLLTLNGFSITCNGHVEVVSTSNGAIGTTNIIMNGTGTIQTSIGSFLFLPVELNTAGTITIGSSLNHGANFTNTAAGSVVTAGSTFRRQASTSNVTSNGIVWNNVVFGNTTGFTITLLDDMTVNGTLTLGTSNSNNYNINGSNIYINGSFNVPVSSGAITGTTNLIFSGTGTWSAGGTSPIRNNLTIDTAGTLTISGTVYYGIGTLVYTAGTVVTTGSSLTIFGSTTLDVSGIFWNQVSFSLPAGTHTLLSDINCNTFIITGAINNTLNGFTVYCWSLTMSALSGNCTTKFVMNGTGTMNLSQGLNADLEINTAGTVTFAALSNVYLGTGRTFKWTAGTVVSTGSTLSINPNTTATIIFPKTDVSLGSMLVGSGAQITFSADTQLTGDLQVLATGVSSNQFFNNRLYVGGSFTPNFAPCNGTTEIILNGTGTWSGTGSVTNNVTIDTAGTITLSGTVNYYTGTLKYIAGTVVTTSAVLTSSENTTYDTDGINWTAVTLSKTAGVFTFVSDMTITGQLTQASGSNIVFNGSTLYLGGNVTLNDSAATITGTTNIVYNGTGTWFGTQKIAVASFEINTSGTLTMPTSGTKSMTVGYPCVFTYTAGTVVAGDSTMNLSAASSLNTMVMSGLGAIKFYNLNLDLGTYQMPGEDLIATNDFLYANNAVHTLNFRNLYVGRNLTGFPQTTSNGTAKIIMNGTGSIAGPNVNLATFIQNDIEINTQGKITFSRNMFYSGGTFTHVAGRLTGGSTIYCFGNATFVNMDGHPINFGVVESTSVTFDRFPSTNAKNPITVQSVTASGLASSLAANVSVRENCYAHSVTCKNINLTTPGRVVLTSMINQVGLTGFLKGNNICNGFPEPEKKIYKESTPDSFQTGGMY